MTARFNHCVLAALRFEMILRLVKGNAGALLQMSQYFAWKIDMAIQTRANRRATERKLTQSLDRFLCAFSGVSDLLSKAGKFLPQPHGRRVHQVGPADLD